MDDLTLRYFEAEMRYLRESGKAFSDAHPDRAALLNMDRVGELDPMVERLFEGFAFLMGKLRQKLDDDLPELTESLVSLLWPHYLRMIPSLSVVEFRPRLNTLQKAEIVEKGVSLRSTPVGEEGIRCQYRTTRQLSLLPLQVREASLEHRADGRQRIRLALRLEAQARRENLDLGRLPFFLCAETPIAFALMQALTRQAESVRLHCAGQAIAASDALCFRAMGFDADDALWPRPAVVHGGYPLLMEYFAFREKFLFVELCGLQVEHLDANITDFELEIVLSRHFPTGMPFDASAFRLHCVPAINLFDIEAEPIHVTHLATAYRVVPMLCHGPYVETFSVEQVQAFDHESGQRHEYLPFSSFRHRGGMLRHDAPERYYHASVRQGVSGRHETWLMLGGHAWQACGTLTEETLSLRVTGTNGMLPRKLLSQAQLLEMTHEHSGVAQVRNLLAPSMPCHPPVEDRFHWRVLSHLTPNYVSLLDAEVLRGTLALYDWTHDEMNRRRLQAISEVGHRRIKRVEQGAVMHGVEITVTLDQAGFSGEGDISLFGELLHHFLAGYADLNLFVRLVLLIQPDGARIQWHDSKCNRPPL